MPLSRDVPSKGNLVSEDWSAFNPFPGRAAAEDDEVIFIFPRGIGGPSCGTVRNDRMALFQKGIRNRTSFGVGMACVNGNNVQTKIMVSKAFHDAIRQAMVSSFTNFWGKVETLMICHMRPARPALPRQDRQGHQTERLALFRVPTHPELVTYLQKMQTRYLDSF